MSGIDSSIEVSYLFEINKLRNIVNIIKEKLDRRIETADIESSTVIFRDEEQDFMMRIKTHPRSHVGNDTYVPNAVKLRADADEIALYDDPEERVKWFLNIVETVYELLDPTPAYAYGVDCAKRRQIWPRIVTETDFEAREFGYTSWLMLFSPSMVERHGREHLLSAPVWEARELGDGAVMLVTHSDPIEPQNTEHISDYLGIPDTMEYHRPD